ncbi:hypothetical protein M569_01088 [Genlisea aurea]|uniref:Macro domain-containing protein n=1 Tax=Genlisea aurea TaxID=192259 RepID=S8D1L6_9LAMI|nr:hypothetical protein M569_01088 [Genlisea aurea]
MSKYWSGAFLFSSLRGIYSFPKTLSGVHGSLRFLPTDHCGVGASPAWYSARRVGRFANMSSGGSSSGRATVEFRISESSVLKIQKGDITLWSVDGRSDAIVNPANERMLGGGGADGAIHDAAGSELKAACYQVPEVRPGVRCPTGEARITPGFRLPASHVIHTVGPIYGVDRNPRVSLSNAYRNSLLIAKNNDIRYIAFTAISCGVFRYPYEEAATVAISTAIEFGRDFPEVHFVLFSDEVYDVWVRTANELLKK